MRVLQQFFRGSRCSHPQALVGSRASDVPAPPGAPSVARDASPLDGSSCDPRRAPLVAFGVALIGAGPALADRIEDKRAEAQQVLADIEALDAELEHSIEAYDAATIELDAIKADLEANRRQMGVARGNLGVAQRRLASRLVTSTSAGSASALEVFLGSTSFEDLINRLDTIDRVSQEDTQVLQEVQRFRTG